MLAARQLILTVALGLITPGLAAMTPTPSDPGTTTSVIGDNKTFGSVLEVSGSSPSAGVAPDGAQNVSGQDGPNNDPCWYQEVPAKLGDPRLSGDQPAAGHLYIVYCPDAINLDTGNLVYTDQGYVWARNGKPVVAPSPDPGQLAEQASGRMTAPDPVIHFGPNLQKIAVKVPIWLWVDPSQPLTLTVTLRGLTVRVTASIKSTTWSMGEPIDEASPSVKVPAFSCDGVGVPSPAKLDPEITAPCGFTYSWKSLANRTNGTGAWAVTATTNWGVTWAASDGTHGALARLLTPSTTQQVTVGEWRGSLVQTTGG